MNLYKETQNKLKEIGLSIKDIKWFGSPEYGYSSDLELFKKLSDIDYDSDFGAAEVATDLVIVGNDFWLDRGEYDGSEWWEEHSKLTKPKKPKNELMFKRLITPKEYEIFKMSCGWNDLETLNK